MAQEKYGRSKSFAAASKALWEATKVFCKWTFKWGAPLGIVIGFVVGFGASFVLHLHGLGWLAGLLVFAGFTGVGVFKARRIWKAAKADRQAVKEAVQDGLQTANHVIDESRQLAQNLNSMATEVRGAAGKVNQRLDALPFGGGQQQQLRQPSVGT